MVDTEVDSIPDNWKALWRGIDDVEGCWLMFGKCSWATQRDASSDVDGDIRCRGTNRLG